MDKKLKIVIVIVLLLALAYAIFCLTDYSEAESTAKSLLNGTENVSVVKEDYGLFVNGMGNDTLMIFYPGAKVEYTSYLPLLVELADGGIDVALVEMPLNIAFFGKDAAGSIMNSTNYSNYILAGHSLGGLTAAEFQNNSAKGDAVILLAAYPKNKVNVPVLSIYGSNDGVLNGKAYNESKTLMSNLTEIIIPGGNHEQFAYYGSQTGDGIANITPENQQNKTANEILKFTDDLF